MLNLAIFLSLFISVEAQAASLQLGTCQEDSSYDWELEVKDSMGKKVVVDFSDETSCEETKLVLGQQLNLDKELRICGCDTSMAVALSLTIGIAGGSDVRRTRLFCYNFSATGGYRNYEEKYKSDTNMFQDTSDAVKKCNVIREQLLGTDFSKTRGCAAWLNKEFLSQKDKSEVSFNSNLRLSVDKEKPWSYDLSKNPMEYKRTQGYGREITYKVWKGEAGEIEKIEKNERNHIGYSFEEKTNTIIELDVQNGKCVPAQLSVNGQTLFNLKDLRQKHVRKESRSWRESYKYGVNKIVEDESLWLIRKEEPETTPARR